MASELRVDKIIPTGGVPTGGGGGVIQVVQTVKKDRFSMTGSTFTDITGMSLTITPAAASSKIFITSTGNILSTLNSDDIVMKVQLAK